MPDGNIEMRSLPPLPEWTRSVSHEKSRSPTLRPNHSESRRHEPYNRPTEIRCGAGTFSSNTLISFWLNTTGKCLLGLARMTSSIHGNSTCRTFLYRNKMVWSAWFWVEGETERLIAKWLRNASTSILPISAGWRLPWKNIYRLIQPIYTFSVETLYWRTRTACRTLSNKRIPIMMFS